MEQMIELPIDEYIKIIEKCDRLEFCCALVFVFLLITLSVCVPLICYAFSDCKNKEKKYERR